MSTIEEELNKQQIEWIAYAQKSQRDSLDNLDTTAKYFVGLVSVVYTFYTSILTYFGLTGQLQMSVYLFVPVVGILLSLALTLLVFSPAKTVVNYSDPTSIMNATIERAKEKRKWLNWGIFLFVISIVLIPVVTGFVFEQLHQNVQLVVSEDSVSYLKSNGVNFEENLTITLPLSIINFDNTSYTVKLNNGNIIKLDKKWVKFVLKP